MSLFSTKNHDGGAALAEPISTVPRKVQKRMQRCADVHGCDTTAELYEAPSTRHSGSFDPRKAGRN